MAASATVTKISTKTIIEDLRKKIVDGDWQVGRAIPPIRELAGKYKTSNQTVQNAVRIIEAEGLIICRSNRPAIVAGLTKNNKGAVSSNIATKQIGVLGLGYTSSFLTRDDIVLDSKREAESWGLRIFAALREEVFRKGYELVVMPLPEQGDCCDELVRRGLNGYVFVGQSRFKRLHELLGKAGIPWICLCGVGKEDEHNVIHANNFDGGYKVGRVFDRLGFSKILLIGNSFDRSTAAAQKVTGVFHAYLRSEKGTDNLKVFPVEDVGERLGYECAKKYIQQFGVPDAIFATGDFLARGACTACTEEGLAIGEDVSVVGATGFESSAHYHPPLSVLQQPMDEMGEGAAKMIVEMIEKNQAIMPSRGFSSRLIIRDSLKVPEEARADIEEIIAE